MNKKLNTALFVVAATLVNLLIVAAVAIALFIPFALWVAPVLEPSLSMMLMLLIMVGAMFASFPIYRRLISWFESKVDMEKYFDPILKPKRGAPKRRD